MFLAASPATITRSTISGNTPSGLWLAGSSTTLHQSTLDGNFNSIPTVGTQAALDSSHLNVRSCTLVEAAAAGAGGVLVSLSSSASTLDIGNFTLSCPTASCISPGGSSVTVQGSLLHGKWGAASDGNIDARVASPRLGPLQDNGGQH